MERFAGRTAVVTGGTSGIGPATVCRLATEGARVVVADVDPDGGAAAAEEVRGLFVRTDVTSEADVAALFAAALDAFGSVDVSFHNAGISPPEDDSMLVVDPGGNWVRIFQAAEPEIDVDPRMHRSGGWAAPCAAR